MRIQEEICRKLWKSSPPKSTDEAQTCFSHEILCTEWMNGRRNAHSSLTGAKSPKILSLGRRHPIVLFCVPRPPLFPNFKSFAESAVTESDATESANFEPTVVRKTSDFHRSPVGRNSKATTGTGSPSVHTTLVVWRYGFRVVETFLAGVSVKTCCASSSHLSLYWTKPHIGSIYLEMARPSHQHNGGKI